ncbi:acyl-CoA synthetase [Tistrella bauzanensis]|uniref:Acyl-CoA synthetase n=1 Tax=Tistrella bauzanensis TaxID=657419 RepID=A0ABQ1IX02_9PROT|nr:acyl-CoA synthetase [Tistrella bauzanensis]GGB54030.1 acyl-CoA synthetase [Tistrella bauzanensis]
MSNVIRRNTINDAVRRSAARFRDQTALIHGERCWSFAQINRAADAIGRRLLDLGFTKGDRLAVYARNSDTYLLVWLGALRAGLVHVPINYALTEPELHYIVEQSGARGLIHDPDLARTALAVADRVDLLLSAPMTGSAFDPLAIALAADDAAPLDAGVADEDLAQILYTSGTTSAPKGAMMTHRALLAEYASCIVELNLKGSDRALAALPLYHSAQMHCFTIPQILVGATSIVIQTPVPALCLELIEREAITSFFAPPTVWISLLRHEDFDRRDLATLTNVYYGASIMPVPVLEELRQRLPGARPYNCYGQSEIGPIATVLGPDEHTDRPASAGRPVMNVETRIVDAQMNDMAPGEQGEIVHRSPQLLIGYWNKPDETEEAFSGDWFHSGDVGYFDEGGFLFVVDRVKDVIKTGGVIVASREVEDALFTHPAVSEVAVIALPDPKWIEAVTAMVVLRPGHEVDAETLIAHARERLAAYKVPKTVHFIDALPRNTAGKILKRTLRQDFAEG